MEYIDIYKHDKCEWVYYEIQKLLRPPIIDKFPRNTQKEAEYYAVKDVFAQIRPISLGWHRSYIIPMCDNHWGIRYKVYNFNNGKENALVAAQYVSSTQLHYARPPRPVFYGQAGIEREHYILFFDNLLLAYALSHSIASRNNTFYWLKVSFLSRDDLTLLDFSLFRDKIVLYYLVEHSGFDWRQTCLNAAEIVKLFPKSTTIFFVSYPERDYRLSNRNDLVFLSSKEHFEAEVESLQKVPTRIDDRPCLTAPISKQHQLLADGLMERTATLLYDGSAMDRTAYLTHWAAAVSQGKSNIRAHKKFPPSGVAYIYVNSSNDDFKDGIQKGFADIINQKLSAPPDNPYPKSSHEMQILIQNEDIFVAYPISDKPFSKLECSTFFYLSFRPYPSVGAKSPEAIVQMLIDAVSNLERNHPDIKILIIDIPALWSFGIDFAVLMGILYSLREQYALILVTNKPHPMQKSSISNLPFDKIIRLQRQNSDPEQIYIDLVTIRDDIGRRKDCLRLAKSVEDKQWKTRGAEKTSVVQKIKYIQQHRYKKIRDVASALGISESYVKKLRSKAGVSQKMPGKAPKNPKRKPIHVRYDSIKS